jgi:hypothetical protein
VDAENNLDQSGIRLVKKLDRSMCRIGSICDVLFASSLKLNLLISRQYDVIAGVSYGSRSSGDIKGQNDGRMRTLNRL